MTLYGYARVSVREPEDKNLDLTVHPHPRGESASQRLECILANGSPPPAWGKPAQDAPLVGFGRFTPTRVGKAGTHPYTSPSSTVHPHPRGESEIFPSPTKLPWGSPPPAWGKPIRLFADIFMQPVHPHPRGESTPAWACPSRPVGSPPPAWGKRHVLVHNVHQPGFTPTRVGKASLGFVPVLV